jgi:hypothetical protein
MMNDEEIAAARLKHQQTLQLRKEEKLKDFDNYIYDYKIWEKCKKIIVFYEDDMDDSDDDDNENEFWMLYWFHELLFEKYYDHPGKYTSRLERLVIALNKAKHEIVTGDVNCTGFLINRYENIKNVIKEWIEYSGIATKQMLIEQLPLCDDVHKLILTLKIY